MIVRDHLAFPLGARGSRVMVFVDGENLAIRYGALLKDHTPIQNVDYEPNVFVWTRELMNIGDPPVRVIRHYYYTSCVGADEKRDEIHERLSSFRIESPRVFPRTKTRGSKRVDISLSVDMLSHAHRRNFDLAVLVAGDEDYVPLVQAVEAEGARVVLWFFRTGLSPALRRTADCYFALEHVFFAKSRGYRDRDYS